MPRGPALPTPPRRASIVCYRRPAARKIGASPTAMSFPNLFARIERLEHELDLLREIASKLAGGTSE
jgi:hypothetical protein